MPLLDAYQERWDKAYDDWLNDWIEITILFIHLCLCTHGISIVSVPSSRICQMWFCDCYKDNFLQLISLFAFGCLFLTSCFAGFTLLFLTFWCSPCEPWAFCNQVCLIIKKKSVQTTSLHVLCSQIAITYSYCGRDFFSLSCDVFHINLWRKISLKKGKKMPNLCFHLLKL